MSTNLNNAKGKMFDNPMLEMLSKSSPPVTFITYGSIIFTFIFFNFYLGEIRAGGVLVSLFLGGLLFWTLAEYLLHRFLFHWINDSAFVKRFHYSVHGYHHDYPRDETRVFMPPLPGLFLSSVFLCLYYLILGDYAFMFTAGFINGYLLYASIHWSTHRFKPPRQKWLKVLWRHHNMHHFRHPDKAFGVSSPLWDFIFGTMPPKPNKDKKKVKKLADVVGTEMVSS